MWCSYACNSADHAISRRGFLASAAAGALSLGAFTRPALSRELNKQQKRVLMVWLHGGVSQLETWDPKPGTATGGPFQAIPTSVPGIHICELLPYTAKIMHHLALVRGLNTTEDDHGKGAYIMHTGRRQEPAMQAASPAPVRPVPGVAPIHRSTRPVRRGRVDCERLRRT